MRLPPQFGFLAATAVVLLTFAWSEEAVRPKAPDGKVHVTYWEKWTGIEFDAIKSVVDDFNNSQDRIHVDLLSVSGIHNKTLMATAAGVPPDVAGLYSANVAQYVYDDAIIPLDDYCKKAGISAKDYIPVYWDMGVMDGHIYALPTTPATNALHYNKALFQRAGLDPNRPPKTIEEMDADAKKITSYDKDGRLKVMGFMHNEPGWWNWAWGEWFGGKMWNGKDTITCDSPENIRGFRWVQSYSKQFGATNLTDFKSGFGKFDSPQNAFMAQKVAMELQGVWMSNFINTYNPQLQWGAAPFPYPADRPDLKGSTIAESDILVIPRGAKHPDEAFEFIKYVQSQKAMEKLCLGQKKHSPLAKASDQFYEAHPNPFIHLFTDIGKSPNVITTPKIAIWPEYQAELRDAFDQITVEGIDPAVALKRVKDRMQPQLDRYLEQKRLRAEAKRK
ncbi:MAG TPA: ABC transporter substrate-binding protein [Fimbriimonadaceae bacterium]|nr:ABC transporter substrate-binding protein [Fimbriimonadaceae bacterium]